MPASLEVRRLAVADALRSAAREDALTRVRAAVAAPAAAVARPKPARVAAPSLDVRAVETRLDALSRQISEVLTRLGSVETAVLESVWERQAPEATPEPAPYADAAELDEEEPEPDDRVSVPAVPLGEVRMSSVASRALFGG